MRTRTIARPCLALLALSLAAPACANRPAESTERGATTQPPSQVTVDPEPEPAETVEEELYALHRALHGSEMSEAVLDAHARSALTMDRDGGVRLWPELQASEVSTPLSLPVQDPSWMSLAKADDGSFLVAFVDTAGVGRVARVETTKDGARYRPLFETSVTEPLFELHAIDGGQRVLGLRVDHRVELFDAAGEVVSSIDQAGFVPWQLRVSPRPGAMPSVVAVLAGPTRVQSLSIEADRIAIDGEARTVVIDRGPNRNDLSLSPDGTTVAALRKPRSRKSRITIELIDLATDERRLVVGETDDRRLPRMHWADDQHLLLESGTGHGFWVDLDAAIPWTGETGRDETEGVDAVAFREVALPYSEGSLRSHASVVQGLRAVPTEHALVLDPLDEDVHRVLGREPVRPEAVALDDDGGRFAWSAGGQLVIEDLDDASGPRVLGSLDAVELAFVGEDRIVAVTSTGEASLRSTDDGQEIASHRVPMDGSFLAAGFVRGGSGGQLAVLADSGRGSLRSLEVAADGFGEDVGLSAEARLRWPELGVPHRALGGVTERLGFEAFSPKMIRAMVVDADGRHHVASSGSAPILVTLEEGGAKEWLLRPGSVERLVPDPTGQRIAVVQLIRSSDVFVDFERRADLDEYAVSVVDLATGEREWTRAATGFEDLDWSGDGQRLAVAGRDGGRVIEVGTGAVRLDRRHLGLEVKEASDPSLDG